MKRLLSLGLCGIMLVSSLVFPVAASAEELSGDLEVTTAESNVPLDFDSMDGTVTELPAAIAAEFEEEAEAITPIVDDLSLPNELPSPNNDVPINLLQRSGNTDFHFSGTIAETNGMYTIYPIVLSKGQNIHAELVGPTNTALNYDLRLYEMNASTGELSSLVDICSYSGRTSTSALPQTVATINRTSAPKTYALIVYALVGYSATETFDVNITLGTGGDPAESNDNAFTSYSLGMLSVDGISVQGTTLDSPKDVDWFYFGVPQQSDYNKIRIGNNANSKVNYQLYYVQDGTTLVEVKPENGLFPVRTGANYLRVTDNGNNFANGDVAYDPYMTVSFNATKIYSQFKMDDLDDIPTQTYKVWNLDETEYHPEKRNALLGSCRLEWTVTYASASGSLCTDTKDKLHITVTDYAWVPVQFQTASASASASNGVATCVVDPSVGCRGQLGGVSGMSYDTDCFLEMSSDKFGSITNGRMPIFVTSRIMS